ncbi:hypothetical protein [Streptomyces rhizosphaericus]|nr:hypothetical protein [Streptomyces rhizosphaericus]
MRIPTAPRSLSGHESEVLAECTVQLVGLDKAKRSRLLVYLKDR